MVSPRMELKYLDAHCHVALAEAHENLYAVRANKKPANLFPRLL